MSEGNITRRGKKSWRLKYEAGQDEAGKRKIAYVTVRGTRADAERELRARLYRQDKGVAIEPSKATVADYLDSWLADVAPRRVGPKALERYRGLARNQVRPHLGTVLLQKLRPADISAWHGKLAATGIATRTIRHAHGLLRTSLAHAAAVELVERNVAAMIKPPSSVRTEIEILNADQISDALAKLVGHSLHPIAALAIGTGARRGELAALRWSDVDLAKGSVRIERALEQTKGSLRVKAPKTRAGIRTVSLPTFCIAALRDHRRAQQELRLALGLGRLPESFPVFGGPEGELPNPYSISDRWRDAVKNRKLPKVTFHALRHSHASALIAAGLDVVAVSRRLGHASPSITLGVYGHLFRNDDSAAAKAIDAALSC